MHSFSDRRFQFRRSSSIYPSLWGLLFENFLDGPTSDCNKLEILHGQIFIYFEPSVFNASLEILLQKNIIKDGFSRSSKFLSKSQGPLFFIHSFSTKFSNLNRSFPARHTSICSSIFLVSSRLKLPYLYACFSIPVGMLVVSNLRRSPPCSPTILLMLFQLFKMKVSTSQIAFLTSSKLADVAPNFQGILQEPRSGLDPFCLLFSFINMP